MSLFKKALLTYDFTGAPNKPQKEAAEAYCEQMELDYPGIIIYTQDAAGIDQPPRKKLPTVAP